MDFKPKGRGMGEVTPDKKTSDTATKLSAANISIQGETGATTKEEAKKKSSQIHKDDPQAGEKSYGIFGMNTLSKTVHGFVNSNPQLGFTSKPGTKEFDNEWIRISNEIPDEFYDLQLKWYEKNIWEPTKKIYARILPRKFASDPRILALLADRKLQYGGVMERQAIEYALKLSGSLGPKTDSVQEFIDRITLFDEANLYDAFATSLSTNPSNEKGLFKRVQLRKAMALQFPIDVGERVYTSSTENRDMKKELKDVMSQTTIIFDNQNIVNQRIKSKNSSK